MTGEPGMPPRPPTDVGAPGQQVFGLVGRERDALLDWVGENQLLVRRSAFGDRTLHWSLAIGFVLGLIAHVGGFLLRSAATSEPLLLVADVLYSLGMALWTGIVVVLFVQVWPAVKKRQFKQALEAYEAAVGHHAGEGRSPDRTSRSQEPRDENGDRQDT